MIDVTDDMREEITAIINYANRTSHKNPITEKCDEWYSAMLSTFKVITGVIGRSFVFLNAIAERVVW